MEHSALILLLEEAVRVAFLSAIIIFLLCVIAFMMRFFVDTWRHWGRGDE